MSANIKPAASTALVLQDEGGTDVITISTSGNVGVGNGSPAQKLDVTGNINATGALTLGTALAIAEGGTGATTASGARVALDLEIGVDVEAYSATNADYADATANFTGTLQNGGSNVLVDTDIGSTVQAYDADTAKYDAATANFTGTLQNGGSNVVVDSDIGSTVQAYDADTTKNDVSNTFTANQIISVNDNTNAALRITQTGTGNALVVEDSANPDSTPFVVNNSGQLLIGQTSAKQYNHYTSGFGLQVSRQDSGFLQMATFQNNTTAADLVFAKSRGGSLDQNTVVQSGDFLGNILFIGADGTNYVRAAAIQAQVDGTPGTNDMPGRLVFSTTADGASSPTERMRIDSSGNVGIGTTSPNSKLNVSTNSTDAAVTITQTGSGNALVVEDSTNPDSTPFVVDASGRVGIGTTSLNGRINIANGTIEFDPGTTTDSERAFNFNISSSNYAKLLVPSGSGGALAFWVGAANSATERMRIDSAGNVGIGTASPSYPLHVASDNGIIGLIPDSTNGNTIRFGGVGGSANQLIFTGASDAERMRIDGSGNALIGYTSSNGSYKLQVNSQIFATSATIATSDGRYKENITSLDGALNLVAQLNPVQFTWKEHPVHEFDRSQPTVGFIAQEVQEVLKDTPYVNSIIKANECTIEDAVYETIEISPAITEELDENGEIITPAQEAVTEQRLVSDAVTEEFLGIAEGNLIALLTKALQEANAKIDALETRIQALEV